LTLSSIADHPAAHKIAVIATVILCGSLLSWVALRFLRARHPDPKYIPGIYLKRKWRAWQVGQHDKRWSSALHSRSRSQGQGRSLSPATSNRILRSSGHFDLSPADLALLQGASPATVVDRNASIRSTITLPAYEPIARPTEKILGRAGDRAGIDTVVEFPETADEEEARREEHMEAIYQARRARRDERAARDDRHRLQRDARARGDAAALERLRAERLRAAAEEPSTAALLARRAAPHERGRAVSTVEYSDLGVARADGSRVRASSNTSSHRPLLRAAAPAGESDALQPPDRPFGARHHLRAQSSSSLRYAASELSDDDEDDDDDSVSRAGSGADAGSVHRPRTGNARGRSSSHLSLITTEAEADDGLLSRRPPPQYDYHGWPGERRASGEAPPYSPVTTTGAPRIPAFAPLPAIEIIASSPVIQSS